MSLISFFVFCCAILFSAFNSSSPSARDVLMNYSFFFYVSSKISSVVKSGGGTKSGFISGGFSSLEINLSTSSCILSASERSNANW